VLVQGRDYRTGDRTDITYSDEPLLYLRFNSKQANSVIVGIASFRISPRDAMLSPLRTGLGGWSTYRNLHGGIVYSNDDTGTSLLSSTQLFRNGELWGIDLTAVRYSVPDRRTGGRMELLPMRTIEEILTKGLEKYLAFATTQIEPWPSVLGGVWRQLERKDRYLGVEEGGYGNVWGLSVW